MIVLTQDEINILSHEMVDPEYYVNGEDANIGKKTVPREHLDAKLALVKPGYDAAVLVGNYKNMAERESEIIDPTDQTKWTPMKRWKYAMAYQERMGGIDRDFEDLITDNPALALNEYTQTKYDDKVALRATKP